MGRGRIGTFAAIVFAGSSLSHCVGATEILVDLRTDVGCDVVAKNGATIAVGDGISGEAVGVVTKATSCDAGEIGTIALTPGQDIGGPVAVRVVLGVSSLADDCSPVNKYGGCIVARRSLRYSPHTMLSLPIDLDQDCLDHPCGPETTCVHGSCTDAGTVCENNVCGIDDAGPPADSGPIDAGACTDVSVTVSPVGLISTPRIARTTSGYAIAWQDVGGTIAAEIIDANGKTIKPPETVLTNGGTPKLDAIAADKSEQNYFVVFEDGGNLDGLIYPTTSGTSATATQPTAAGPVNGAFWEDTQNVWITTATRSVASFYVVTPSGASTTTTTISTGSTSHVALARFGTTYYATNDEGTLCIVRRCALSSSSTFNCTQLGDVLNCSALRAVADGTSVAGSYVSNGVLSFQPDLTGGFAYPVGPVDDPDAMVPLIAGSTPFRVVWRGGGVIRTDTFPTQQTNPIPLGISAYGTAAGAAGFDAVADDPSETGYAVVYTRSNVDGGSTASIQFLHRCK